MLRIMTPLGIWPFSIVDNIRIHLRVRANIEKAVGIQFQICLDLTHMHYINFLFLFFFFFSFSEIKATCNGQFCSFSIPLPLSSLAHANLLPITSAFYIIVLLQLSFSKKGYPKQFKVKEKGLLMMTFLSFLC